MDEAFFLRAAPRAAGQSRLTAAFPAAPENQTGLAPAQAGGARTGSHVN